MDSIIGIQYKYPIQIKTLLSYMYEYKKYMLEYPYFILSDNIHIVCNKTNNVFKNVNNYGDFELKNLRIGSSHKPRTAQRDAKYDGFKNINVTSVVKSPFSPLKGETNPVWTFEGLKFENFENFWQAHKVFSELGHIDKDGNVTDKFMKWLKDWSMEKEGYRIIKFDTKTKDKSVKSSSKSVRQMGYKPVGAYHDDRIVSYVESRDYYLREYIKVIKERKYFKDLLESVEKGQNIMILDLDGPPLDKYPNGRQVNWDMLEEAMNDPTHPFGHGYVICCLILMISQYKK